MKRGASQMIATVLLIGITITLASIILVWGNLFFIALAPPVNCDKIDFQAGIYETNLNIINVGNEYLYGVVIKKINDGSLKVLEEIIFEEPIKSGYSYTEEISFLGNILVVPIIETDTEEEILATCQDRFGVEIIS